MNAQEAREKLAQKIFTEKQQYLKELNEMIDVSSDIIEIDRRIELAIENGRNRTFYFCKDIAPAAGDKIQEELGNRGYKVNTVYGGSWEEQQYKLRIEIEW